jgi:hypothetical protein
VMCRKKTRGQPLWSSWPIAQGPKEADFREMNELVAATAHDCLLHVKNLHHLDGDRQPHHKLRLHGHCSN